MKQFRWLAVAVILAAGLPIQDAGAQTSFVFKPAVLSIPVGDTAQVTVSLVNADGKAVAEPFLLLSRGGGLEILERSSGSDGVATSGVVAHRPGSYTLLARTAAARDERVTGMLEVDVPYPPLREIVVDLPRADMYPGGALQLTARVIDEAGLMRDDVTPALTSTQPAVATVDRFGVVTALAPGTTEIRASAEGLVGRSTVRVVQNPVKSIRLTAASDQIRTGDVLHIDAVALDAGARAIADAPIDYTVASKPDDNLGQPASAQVAADGRFVAETPGLYTVFATSGSVTARVSVRVTPRNVGQELELLGHAPVLDVHTSDLWVWEGIDGRDYAVTGTWSANGEAYFWDVTDPRNMQKVDEIKVDARTVNDVKVSEDGRVCVISREGASTRRNGIVILDCSNPRDVTILAEYDDELTGGVHNVFIYDKHVYAVNNGRRYDVISIEDPAHPVRVGRFELDSPGHAIHDVWIEDGIAYSSNWRDGLQLVDIGGGAAAFAATGDESSLPKVDAGAFGGSPSNPVQFASYTYPSGWNHAAFPYRSKSTGRFYVIAGDEAFPYNEIVPDAPERAAGWLHFVDFSDLRNPKEVARYQVPEAGSHNYWVDGDMLYAGFYNGGLRIVDLSGELMGDLYRQGREIARFLPSHPDGVVRNNPMVWGVQPHKGTLFVADHYSGLWAVRLVSSEE